MVGDKKSISSSILWISLRTLMNVLIVFLLVEGFTNAYHFSYKLFADYPYVAASSETMNVTIEAGSDVNDVATVLDEMGIVDSKYLFIARAYIGKYNDKIMAGSYVLGPGMTPDEICRRICGMQSEETT